MNLNYTKHDEYLRTFFYGILLCSSSTGLLSFVGLGRIPKTTPRINYDFFSSTNIFDYESPSNKTPTVS